MEVTRGKWKNESEHRGVKVEMGIQVQDPQPILGSRAEIREALTNLIFNSVDALPKGGAITIRCRSEEQSAILEVADNGVGMTEEIRGRMFEPFFTTKGVSGNGLGLSMVYGIVSRHRGTVEVDTAPDAGTVVRMRFPATVGEKNARPGRQVVRAPFQARILVVDDGPDLRPPRGFGGKAATSWSRFVGHRGEALPRRHVLPGPLRHRHAGRDGWKWRGRPGGLAAWFWVGHSWGHDQRGMVTAPA